MTPAEVVAVLTKIAAYDGRKIDDAAYEAWNEAIGDLDAQDCLTAVAQHFRDSEDYLKPARVRRLATDEARRRHGRERQAALGGPPGACGVPGCPCTTESLALAARSNPALTGLLDSAFQDGRMV